MEQKQVNQVGRNTRITVERKDVTYSIFKKPVSDTKLINYYYYTEVFKASE